MCQVRILRRTGSADLLVFYTLTQPLQDVQGGNLTAADGGAKSPPSSRWGLECLDGLANNFQLLRFFLKAGRRQTSTSGRHGLIYFNHITKNYRQSSK